MEALYSTIVSPVVRTDPTTAEMIKYASNAMLVTKIPFINGIAILSEKVGSDIDDIAYGSSSDLQIAPSSLGPANGTRFDLLAAVIKVVPGFPRNGSLIVQSSGREFSSANSGPELILGASH